MSNHPKVSQSSTSSLSSEPFATALFYTDDQWQPEQEISRDRITETVRLRQPGIEIIFLPRVDSDQIQSNKEFQNDISSTFWAPSFFWTEAASESNGFYNHKKNPLSDFEGLSYGTMSRFLIKEIIPGDEMDYKWQFLSFLSLCYHPSEKNEKPTQVLLCFDLTPEMKDRVVKGFRASTPSSWVNCPLGVYSVIVPVIALYFDHSLWGFRKPIRHIEKNRIIPDEFTANQNAIEKLYKRYIHMHELSRHVIHKIETLQISSGTLKALAHRHETYKQWGGCVDLCDGDCSIDIQFHQRLLENLQCRAIAFKDRLQNEIALAFSLSTAEDSFNTKKTFEDGKELTHLVSTATLLFLPGSFISSIFGTNFFEFGPTKVSTSDQIYIFAVSTVVVTIIGFLVWSYFTGKLQHQDLKLHWQTKWKMLRRRHQENYGSDTENGMSLGQLRSSGGTTFSTSR